MHPYRVTLNLKTFQSSEKTKQMLHLKHFCDGCIILFGDLKFVWAWIQNSGYQSYGFWVIKIIVENFVSVNLELQNKYIARSRVVKMVLDTNHFYKFFRKRAPGPPPPPLGGFSIPSNPPECSLLLDAILDKPLFHSLGQ